MTVALREELDAKVRVWFIARREKAQVSDEGPAMGMVDVAERRAVPTRKRAAFILPIRVESGLYALATAC